MLSRLTARTVNGLATNYTYKDITADKTTTLVKSIETSGITHTYEYDSLGNITSIYDGSRTTTYKYDELNQLVRADNPYENKTHIYSYLNGNITEDKVYEYTTGNLPEYPESQTQYLYENVTWSDILTGVKKSHFDNGVEIIDDRYSINSDTIGNITNLNDSEYSWLGRQLQSVSNSDNLSTTYSYNADGQRIAKVVNGKDGEKYTYNYYYNGDILAGFTVVGNNSESLVYVKKVVFMYDENGDAFGFSINGNEYFYVKNAQNDVIAIVDSNNETVVSYKYDSWGKLISCEDTSENHEISFLNPYTYRGYYYDSDTEMYFLKSRYYSPELCRFISSDDSDTLFYTPDDVTDKNLFAYCDNNPISRMDIDGDLWAWAIGAVVGGVVGIAGQIVSDIISMPFNGKFGFSNWQTYAGAFVGGAVGGAVLGATGNVGLSNAVSGFITTGVGLSLEKITGKSDKSWMEIGTNATVDGAISYGLSKLPGVKKITKGRNCNYAVYRSGLTKLRNSTAKRMSRNVILKGIVSSGFGGLPMDGYYGVKQSAYDRIKRWLFRR